MRYIFESDCPWCGHKSDTDEFGEPCSNCGAVWHMHFDGGDAKLCTHAYKEGNKKKKLPHVETEAKRRYKRRMEDEKRRADERRTIEEYRLKREQEERERILKTPNVHIINDFDNIKKIISGCVCKDIACGEAWLQGYPMPDIKLVWDILNRC